MMRAPLMLSIVVGVLAPAATFAQRGGSPPPVVERIDTEENGGLSIVYSDGTRVLAPKGKDWQKEDGPTSYEEPAIAADRETVGWLVNFKNDTTSYDIPLSLMIYRSGKVIRKVGDGFLIYEWHFWADGKEVVFHSGQVHGDAGNHGTRVDIVTGKVLGTYDEKPGRKPPIWAKAQK